MGFFLIGNFFLIHLGAQELQLPSELVPGMELETTLGFMFCLL